MTGNCQHPDIFILFQETAIKHGAGAPDGAAGVLAGCGKVVLTGN